MRLSGNWGLSPIFSALLTALALHGCATVPPPSPPPQLASVPAAFEMSGRISVRQADRSDIAKLRWTHRAGSDLWVVSSPLGNEVARIEADARGASLRQAGATEQQAGSFAALTERMLGVPLDPGMLAAWLHGDLRAVPEDWRVSIDESQQAGAVTLARLITARRGDVVVRLVLDDYQALAE